MNHRRTRSVHPLILVVAAGAALAAESASQAQTNWTAPVDGSWFDPARWTAGVPVGNVVTLGLAGAYTVTLQNANGSAGPLTISNPAATLSIFDNTQLNVGGNISNAGLIQISGPGAPGNLTRLAVNAPSVVHSGGGTIRLAASGNGDNDTAYITNFPGAGLSNAAGSFVAGAGRIYAPFNNAGTVNADQNGKGLFLQQIGKTNDGLITASNGGFVQLRTSMTQSATGVMQSSDNSPIQINPGNAVIAGGTLNGAGVNSGVQYFGFSVLNGVTLLGSHAVADNSQVSIGAAGVINNGTWTVSSPSAPGNLTRIATAGTGGSTVTTISGNGTLRLQGVGGGNGDNDSAYLTYGTIADVLTNGPQHSIRGYGRVYTPLSNEGTVNADVAGKGMFMVDRPKWNNSTMTATNGGVLQFRTSLTQNPGGVVLSSDNSPVQFSTWGLVEGGTLNGAGANGGVQFFGTGQLNNVTLLNNSMVMDAAQVNIREGGVVNNGLWTIGSPAAPGNNTRIAVGGTGNPTSATISGTGTLRLQGIAGGTGDNDTAYIIAGTVNDVLTNAAGHSIRGYGRIYTNLVNNGTVDADNTPNASGPTSKGLFFIDRPKTNNATITSSNGGFWYLRGITLTNNGTLSSSNTTVSGGGIENATVIGGTLANIANQPFGINGTSAINTSTITPGSVVQVNDSAALNTSGLTNNGTIAVSTPTAAGNLTRLQAAAANVVINGTGTIRLQGVQGGNGDNDSAYLQYTAAGNQLVNGSAHTIAGYGRIYTNLVNEGTIHADNTPNAGGPASKGIFFLQQEKTNNGTITSSNGGFWYVRGITLINGPSGVMSSTNTAASGGGFENCTVIGGTMTNTAGQSFGTAGTATFDGPTITPGSTVQVNDNSALALGPGGVVNNGTIFIQRIGGAGNLTRLTAAGAATVSGSGTVRLQAIGLNSDSAYLQGFGDAANPLTIGSAQSLTGSGRLYGNITIRGTVSPDQPFGTPGPISRIDVMTTGSKVLTSESAYTCQIASVSSYDQIGGSGSLTVGGALNVTLLNGFDPAPGSTFDVVSGPTRTGSFATVNLPTLANKKQWFVIYGPNYVRLYATCYANCDGSSGSPALTANDFACFLNKFAAGDPYADCDGVGGLTANDFACFLNRFANGCN